MHNMTEAGTIDPERIRRDAVAQAGIEDCERALFDRNLDVLAHSINREGDLSVSGAERLHGSFVTSMANRLQTLRWVADHPDILDEPIAKPIFLTGLPRSGTTFFQHLFDCDSDLRLIRTWETMSPCPPPAVDPASVERRIAAVIAADEQTRKLVRDYDAIHLRDPKGPEECHAFLAQSFSAIGFHNILNVPSYAEYLFSELDLEAAYRVHKRQLQLLQWRGPRKRWAVKYPNHLIAMNEILRIYPDANFVMTHRDPVQTLASLCRLTEAFRTSRMRRIDSTEIGAQMFDFVGRHVDCLMAFTETEAGRSRVISVDYYKLLAAPAEELAQVYERLGTVMPEAARREVSEWQQRNPKGKRGAFNYNLESFGLEPARVRERFAPYMARFGVRDEAEGLRVVS